ncbi:translation initiation factor IF-2 [Hydrogenophilus thiooxidans]|uniref:translation initiation factor IF-2 n=1 Tax=Hydrogenophilus thiooxidans TaxID=2820326 RepID=UPI001C224FCF|nr:translation initiation factor IF-2 [Hydrogenophilus thiooxidans]
MDTENVKAFAQELGVPVAKLITQLREAGVSAEGPESPLTADDKAKLLDYLKRQHGAGDEKRITLKRKETTAIRATDASGRARTVQVEVRKKRVLVKKEALLAKTQEEKAKVEAALRAGETPLAAPSASESPVRASETAQTETAHATVSAAEKARPPQEGGNDVSANAASTEPNEAARPEPALEPPEAVGKAQPVAQPATSSVKRKAKAQKGAEAKPGEPVAKDRTLHPVLSPEELERRRLEAERQAKLRAIQEAELRERRAREAARQAAKQAEAAEKGAAEEDKPSADNDALQEVTPVTATETAKKAKEKGKKTKEKEREERANRKGGLKVRALDDGESGWKGKGSKKKGNKRQQRDEEHGFQAPTEPVVREIHVPETITVAELAHAMAVKAVDLIKTLMKLGVMATINQVLDQETAMLAVEEMGHKAVAAKLDDPDAFLETFGAELDRTPEPRPPVVTVMGHVDHGKTSLLDFIRRTKVAAGEAGGITQHIGAYHVETPKGVVTFLDTPGHEAFTAMRARGAQATDVVVLVVAADDGVMPQTREAIHHAKAANVPIVVAVNKIDKPEANPDRVRQELVAEGVIPEEYGGDTIFVNVSAKTGQGIDELLESILLVAEVLELKAPKTGPAKGLVIEARLDRGRGPVATVLVQSGTLRRGDVVLAGATWGRVRAMLDETGRQIDEAGPSMPAEILGLEEVPQAGEAFYVLPDERKAREIALYRQGKYREQKLAKSQALKLENLFDQMGQGDVKKLPIIVKADVQGSAEALAQALTKLSTDEVQVQVVHSGVGGITESDVNLAQASGAVIIGFNVRADANARKLAETYDVDIRYYNIIYDAVDEVKAAMAGLLSPERKEETLGLVEVRQTFRVPKVGTVAGCYVLEGVVRRSARVRVLRDNVVIYEGELDSLKRFKEDVREVKAGYECGLSIKNFQEIQEGDQIEVFEVKEVARTL